jgi:hypothetical protein
MNTQTQYFKSPNPLAARLNRPAGGLGSWMARLRLLPVVHYLLGLAAAVLVIGMLLAFYTVVTQAVSQSLLRQQALTARAQALGRCQLLASVSARSRCLLELPALPGSGG